MDPVTGVIFTLVFYLVFPLIVITAFCKMAGFNPSKYMSFFIGVLTSVVTFIATSFMAVLILVAGLLFKKAKNK